MVRLENLKADEIPVRRVMTDMGNSIHLYPFQLMRLYYHLRHLVIVFFPLLNLEFLIIYLFTEREFDKGLPILTYLLISRIIAHYLQSITNNALNY